MAGNFLVFNFEMLDHGLKLLAHTSYLSFFVSFVELPQCESSGTDNFNWQVAVECTFDGFEIHVANTRFTFAFLCFFFCLLEFCMQLEQLGWHWMK